MFFCSLAITKIQLFIEKLLFLPYYFGVGNFSALIFVESGGDRNRAVHHYDGTLDANRELVDKSISARRETVKNMEQ